MGPAITLRRARLEDAAQLARLSTQLGYPATAADIAGRLSPLLAATTDNAVLVVCADGAVVGWTHVLRVTHLEIPAYAEIAALVVDQGYRNARLGERLIEAAVDWTRAAGLDTLRVRSNVVRADAHRFYQRLGFEAEKTQIMLRRRLSAEQRP